MSDNVVSMSSSLFSIKPELMDIVEFFNLDPKIRCTKCSRRPRNPYQSGCGHLFCKSCLDEMMQESQGQPCPCPSLEAECEPIVRNKVNPDASAQREIRRAKVYCIYKKYGCEETPMLMKLQEHIDSCHYVNCEFCNERLLPDQIDEHNRVCENKPRRCKYHHMGCMYELKKSVLLLHEKEDSLHLEMALDRVTHLENNVHELTKKIQTVQSESESFMQQLEVLVGAFDKLQGEFLSLRDKQKLAEVCISSGKGHCTTNFWKKTQFVTHNACWCSNISGEGYAVLNFEN